MLKNQYGQYLLKVIDEKKQELDSDTFRDKGIMNMIYIGIICPSEIAFRRFLPALTNAVNGNKFHFVGIAIASPIEWFGDLSKVSEEQIDEQQSKEKEKAQSFIDSYGGHIFNSYTDIVTSDEIDAVYIPLPPALHYKWAKLALENGKHVMVEKPSTTCYNDTKALIDLAGENNLALHENYMFVFHKQINEINQIICDGTTIGKPKLYRITFGFPRRALNDFRYNKKLGGGALLDAGGYTIRYAIELLGDTARVTTASVGYDPDFEVEIFGAATMVNDDGMTAQLAFGMDNDYRCDLEVWGTKGTLTTGRILTAPVGYEPKYTLKQNQEYSEHSLSEDDAFGKSLERFAACIENAEIRKENYVILERQEKLVQQFKDITGV